MQQRKQQSIKSAHWEPGTAARRYLTWMVVLTIFLMGMGTGMAAPDIFPTKGLIYNPGGGSSPTTASTGYYVGARCVGSNSFMDVALWKEDSTVKAYWSFNGVQGVLPVQQNQVPVGSAVIFNDLIYVFVPVYSENLNGNQPVKYTTYAFTVDPNNNYAQTQLQTQFSCMIDIEGVNINTPLNVAATIWNGSIWLFGTGLSGGNIDSNIPMIWSSKDGQNWSCLGWGNSSAPGIYPGPNYIIHDAITINSDQVNGLQIPSGMTSISDTIVLLVVSDPYQMNSTTGTNMYVLYYDPAANAFLKKVPLPMPTVSTGKAMPVNAVGYFGTMNGSVNAGGTHCGSGPMTWNSGISSVIHVISVLLSNTVDIESLAHWYQDNNGNFVLDAPCSGQDVIWWPAGGCSDLPNCSAAVAPYFVTCQDKHGNINLCSNAMLFSPGFEVFQFNGSQHTTNRWNIPSDNWMLPQSETPSTQNYEPIQASSFEGINSPSGVTQQTQSVNAAMRSLWQIIGVIAGPPPYDNTAFSNNPTDVSSIDFSAGNTTSSSQSSTFSTSYNFSNTTKMGPPFARTKIGIQASTGTSITQGSAQSFTSTLDIEIGTDTIDDTSLVGQLGWVYMSGPNIQPNVYNAHSAEDNSALDYSQTAMTIYGTESKFFEYYLANPNNYIDNGDPGVFGIMNGSMVFPLSSNFSDWVTQPTWELGNTDNAHAGTYKVLVGQFTSTNFPYPAQYQSIGLQGAARTTQSFTSEKSTVHTTDHQTQTAESISEKLEIPLVPELSSKKGLGSKKISGIEMFTNATEMDFSQGWETDSTSESDVDTGLTLTYLSAGMLSSDTVVPYLLQATSPDAPWVPTGYTGPLPWLLTWQTSGADTQTASEADAAAGTSSKPAFGRTPAPEMAGGTITGYAKPNSSADMSQNLPRQDSYFIKGGKLAYMKPYGQTAHIPMTAADFNPSTGVKLNINKTDIPISSTLGKWTLTGRVWKYKSTPNPKKTSVELSLDFGTGTWDLDVSKAILWWDTEPLNPVVITTLTLNDRYILINRLGHSVAFEWDADLNSVEGQEYGIDTIHVERDYQGKGHAVISGYMPDVIKEFGDFSVKMNRSQYDIPITQADGFLMKLATKSTITYSNASSAMTADISNGTWSCSIDAAQFERPHPVAGKDGKVGLQLKLGGRTVFNQRISCDYYKMNLMYGTPQSDTATAESSAKKSTKS